MDTQQTLPSRWCSVHAGTEWAQRKEKDFPSPGGWNRGRLPHPWAAGDGEDAVVTLSQHREAPVARGHCGRPGAMHFDPENTPAADTFETFIPRAAKSVRKGVLSPGWLQNIKGGQLVGTGVGVGARSAAGHCDRSRSSAVRRDVPCSPAQGQVGQQGTACRDSQVSFPRQSLFTLAILCCH